MIKKVLLLSLLTFFFLQKKELPKYITKIEKQDSVYLATSNKFKYPIHLLINDKRDKRDRYVVLYPKDSIIFHKESKKKFYKKFLKRKTIGRFIGDPTLKKYDTTYSYLPPVTRGKNYKIIQGYNGSYSHNKITSRYALDFAMPIGDTIVAARGGIVVRVVEKNKIGGRNKKYYNYDNNLLIYHQDGTFAQYVHLDHQGVLVEVGDSVKKGQPIALSGNTGWSTQPHLHFSVYTSKKGKLISIPVNFNGVSGFKFKKGMRLNY